MQEKGEAHAARLKEEKRRNQEQEEARKRAHEQVWHSVLILLTITALTGGFEKACAKNKLERHKKGCCVRYFAC